MSNGITIMTYTPDSNGARDYASLTKEIIAQKQNGLDIGKKQTTWFKEHVFKSYLLKIK